MWKRWGRWSRQATWGGGGSSPVFTVSGSVSDWEAADLAGVLLTLTGGYTATTNANGDFTLVDVPAGSYTLTPTKAGVTFNPTSLSVTVVASNVTGKDFQEQVWVVDGTITDWEGADLSGVLVSVTGDKTTSDTTVANGTYALALPDGSYTLTPTKAGVTFNPTSIAVTVSGASQLGKDFAEQVYAVSGNVDDWEGANLSGVLVSVTGDKTASDTTDASGNFSIDLPNGSYTLTPTKAGVVFTPASTAVTVAGSAQSGKDFAQATHTLSGTVSGDADSGVTVTLTGDQSDSTTTAGDGTYSFTLPNGDYNVEPSLADHTFAPTDTDVTIADGDQTGKDFTSTANFLALPFTYNFGSQGSSVNDPVSGLDGFANANGVAAQYLYTADLVDANGYTPSGVTMYAGRADTSTASWDFKFPDSKVIDPSLTGIRAAALMYCTGANRRFSRSALRTANTAERALGATDAPRMIGWILADMNPDGVEAYIDYGDTAGDNTGVVTANDANTNASANRWCWSRVEMNFVTHKVYFSAYRAEDGAKLAGHTHTMDATGQALSAVPAGFSVFEYYGYDAVYYRCAGFWIGSLDDAWPTSTLSATTDD